MLTSYRLAKENYKYLKVQPGGMRGRYMEYNTETKILTANEKDGSCDNFVLQQRQDKE